MGSLAGTRARRRFHAHRASFVRTRVGRGGLGPGGAAGSRACPRPQHRRRRPLTSSSRFWTSSSRLTRSLLSPSLSLSVSSRLLAIWVSNVLTWLVEADLARDGDLREPVEPVGFGAVALAAELVGAPAGGPRLVAPLARGVAGLAGVVLDEPQVADGLRDGLLGLGDVVGEVPDQLIEHLLGVFGPVEQRVDVGANELPDAAEDRCLCHDVLLICDLIPLLSDTARAAYQRPPLDRPPPPRAATAAADPAEAATERRGRRPTAAAPETWSPTACRRTRRRPSCRCCAPPPVRMPPMMRAEDRARDVAAGRAAAV